MEPLTDMEFIKVVNLFEYNNYTIRNLDFLRKYLSTSYFTENKVESKFIKTELTLFEDIYQDTLWYHEKEEFYYQLNNNKYLNMTFIYDNIRKFISKGLIVDNDKPYRNYFDVDIDYMESLSNDYYITSYISDNIRDITGYYVVKGKIYYDEYDSEKFDFYEIKTSTRKRAEEYRHRIFNRKKGVI